MTDTKSTARPFHAVTDLTREISERLSDRDRVQLAKSIDEFSEIVGCAAVPGVEIEILEESELVQFADGTIQIVLNVRWRRADGSEVGVAGFEFDTTAQIAEVSVFHLEQIAQSKGLARAVIDSVALLCKKLGIKQLVLIAKNIGRYAWASIGFDFESDEERKQVIEAAIEFAQKLGVEVDLSQIECARDFCDLPGEVAIAKLIEVLGGDADGAADQTISMGKALLLGPTGNDWYGVLEIPTSH